MNMTVNERSLIMFEVENVVPPKFGCLRSIIDSIVWLCRRIYFGPNGNYYTNEPDLPHIQEHIPCHADNF
ncbi:Protein CBG27825 [Caenorhabditis briggsae]|uniref:Protein CBG27825 n=1 Tax=Caenorhabditis briggsae TaxID=6238 RepID=B6IKA7_CAEBR|nr:Protein CBG27825 [Caenorhabditis briggsae]CAS00337.1 Protein CBG27825 [Caenorhabditis briggsae]